MKFDKLRLTGFKSFVEPTDVLIEPGLTGVVGPNGCGKSNLVEALRWAMGEGSYKSVRGTSMDDVIFAGSGKRPARDTAEVTLFLDNATRTAPADLNGADNLEVTRRITRALGSDYRVNGKVVRAQDVKLLFADAATGSRSPSMVRQGQVAELIAAKPTERRNVLEEAAGIAGLRARKHEASLKLNQAEANLSRVDDVGQEVERQVEALKRQARQARRYKALSEEIRKLEAAVHHLRWVEARGAAREAEAALTAARTALTERAAEQTRAATDQAAAEHATPPLRDTEAAAAAALQRVTQALATLDLKDKQAAERLGDLSRTIDELSADLSRLDTTQRDAEAALSRLAAERKDLTAADEGAEARLDDLEAKRQASARAAETAEREATAATERAATALAARKAAAARLERATAAEAAAKVRLQRADAALEGADDGAPLAARDTAATALGEAEAEAARAAEALTDAEAALPASRRADADAQAELQRLEAAVRGRETEAAALTRLTQSLGTDKGVLAECAVAPGYEAAFAAALGDDLAAPVSETAPARWHAEPPVASDPPLPPAARPLAEVVSAPPALARRLAQVGIVDALSAAPLLAAGQRLVTRDGALARWDGFARAAGAPSAAAETLTQKNRLAALNAELADLVPRQAEARAAAEAARKALAAAGAAEKDARRAEQSARKLSAAARDALARAEAGAKKAEAAAAARTAERAAAASALEAILAEKTEAEAEHAATSAGADEAKARESAMEAAAAARRVAREAETSFDNERRAVYGRRKRLERVSAETADWTERLSQSEAHRNQLAARLQKAKAEHAGASDAPSETAAERARVMRALSSAKEKAQESADARAAAERAEQDARKTARAALDALAEAREAAGRAEERDAAAAARLRQVVQDLTEALQLAPEHAHQRAGIDLDAPLPDRAASEQRLERLKSERERLGGVNLVAEDELAELEERRGTMMAERDDLVAAIEKLRQGIQTLNKEARSRLLASFDTVNREFQRLFTHLFGGGEAELKLTEADDPLDAGLDIIARPPGKKPQSLSLLSGGEQTLTATALIFAVFLTNPAPICVLDEIDAPLDDANVERFCALLDEMTKSTDTRFLIITHNPITMARMHRLYGVTMVERGVSQLVSVTLADAEALRESA